MRYYCQVCNCGYYAEAVVREVKVCRMHDVDATERILDKKLVPGSLINQEEWIVCPVDAPEVPEPRCAPRSALRGPVPALEPRPAHIAVSCVGVGHPAETFRIRQRSQDLVGLWRLRMWTR